MSDPPVPRAERKQVPGSAVGRHHTAESRKKTAKVQCAHRVLDAMNFGKRDLGLVLSETIGDADTLRFTKDTRYVVHSSVR